MFVLFAESGGQLGVGLVFWILFIVGLVVFGFGVYQDRTSFAPTSLFWWVLIFLLGIGTFGFPIKL